MEMQLLDDGTVGAGQWNDEPCAAVKPYVCELPQGTTMAGSCVINVSGIGNVRGFCLPAADFATATTSCTGFGGSLARIEFSGENDLILNQGLAALPGEDDVWLGGTDGVADTEMLWTWPDGTVFDDLR